MNNLHTKYINNTLTRNELIEFRDVVSKNSDAEIELQMDEQWRDLDRSLIKAPDSCKKNLFNAINKQKKESVRTLNFRRMASYSAIVVIIALFVTSLYYYNETQYIIDQKIEIVTSTGEKVSVTLPDGTKVFLNHNSYLSYIPRTFGKKQRKIDFNGEAYFDIYKNDKAPFIISDKDVMMRVLGTKFNLLSRDDYEFVEVKMEEGIVAFSALWGRVHCKLVANQSARFDKNTGYITVSDISKEGKVSIWRADRLKFINTTLYDVLKQIELVHGVVINIKGNISTSNDLFTGNISSNDIIEAMEVIEKVYNVDISMVNNIVSISEAK